MMKMSEKNSRCHHISYQNNQYNVNIFNHNFQKLKTHGMGSYRWVILDVQLSIVLFAVFLSCFFKFFLIVAEAKYIVGFSKYLCF